MVFFYLLLKQDTSKQRTIRIQALKNANSKLNNPVPENSFKILLGYLRQESDAQQGLKLSGPKTKQSPAI